MSLDISLDAAEENTMGMLFYLGLQLFLSLFMGAVVYPLPINDHKTVRYRTIPWATILLIVINCCVFGFWQSAKYYAVPRMLSTVSADIETIEDPEFVDAINDAADQYYSGIRDIYTYGYRTSSVQQGIGVGAFIVFTSIFMHIDFSHLVGNMFYLWAYGRRLEDACGSWRFILYYLCCGMIASIGSAIVKSSGADVPSVGASGAIAGVLGGFLLLFPGASISCLWGIGLVLRAVYWGLAQIFGSGKVTWTWTVRIPAFILLVLFGIQNLLPSLRAIRTGTLGGVDTVAHLFGFLGALIIFLFVRKDLLARYFSGRSV
jgi:membrane associated rhomboid family serine protease